MKADHQLQRQNQGLQRPGALQLSEGDVEGRQAPWDHSAARPGLPQLHGHAGSFAAGDTVRYYIHAADASGRSIDHPLTGAHDPHIFSFYPDQVPPVIQHTPPVSVINQDSGPITFSAQVSDNVWVQQVLFSYYSETQPLLSIPMTDADGIYTFEYYPEFTEDDHFLWYQITATDTANPPNQAVYPAPGEWQSIPLMIADNDDPVIRGDFIQSVYQSSRQLVSASSVYAKGKVWDIFNIRAWSECDQAP